MACAIKESTKGKSLVILALAASLSEEVWLLDPKGLQGRERQAEWGQWPVRLVLVDPFSQLHSPTKAVL